MNKTNPFREQAMNNERSATRKPIEDMTEQELEASLTAARESDLDAEASAMRTGKDIPEPTHEPEVRAKLDSLRLPRGRVASRSYPRRDCVARRGAGLGS